MALWCFHLFAQILTGQSEVEYVWSTYRSVSSWYIDLDLHCSGVAASVAWKLVNSKAAAAVLSERTLILEGNKVSRYRRV